MTVDLFADHPFKGRATKEDLRRVSYGLPPIPITGWTPPTSFPRLDSADMICIDCETWDPELLEKGPGWGRGVGHIVGIAVGTRDARWYFPMRHTVGSGNLPAQAVLDWCRDTFANPHQPKVFANAQYDLGWLKHEGVEVAGEIIDVQIAEPLLNEHARSYSLDTLAVKYLGEHKVDSILYDWSYRAYGGKTGRPQAANIYRCPPTLVGPYAEGDVDLPLRIWEKQRYEIEQQKLTEIFKIESQIPRILVDMRMKGVRVDVSKAERVKEELSGKIKSITQQIKESTGERVDLWAADSIARAFDAAGIEYGKTATGKPSFTSEFLDHHVHPLAGMIRAARKYDKAIATFIDGYVLNMQVNGRVHGQFHQLRGDDGGTVVGRFSASLPNLENIPARDPEIGSLVRGLFLPEAGQSWTTMDFSQIQFRIMVHYAMGKGSDEARKKYQDDPSTDYHNLTQQLIKETTGVELQRKAVKCIAEGQLVLTDKGLVPIEKVTRCLRVWDGLKYVEHDGVINQGIKEVITYDGVTATPDHKIWLQTGECISLGEAASRLDRPKLATGEINGAPMGFSNGDRGTGNRESSNGVLFSLRSNVFNRVQQFTFPNRKQQMPVSNTRSALYRRTTLPTRHLGSSSTSLYSTDKPQLQKLRGAGNRTAVYAGRICSVLQRTFPGNLESKVAIRPYKQQRALRTRQYTFRNCERKLTQYPTSTLYRNIRTNFSNTSRSRRMDLYPVPQRARGFGYSAQSNVFRKLDGRTDFINQTKRYANVYDIVNAGDLKRFTVSGKIVSNCVNFGLAFTMGVNKLAGELGISVAEATPLIEAYHAGIPFVRHTSEAVSNVAASRGYITGILGRRHRFPHWEPRDWKLRKEVKLSQDKTEVEAMMRALGQRTGERDIVRAFTHLGLNRLAQDGEGSTMKKALVDCYNQGLFDIVGPPVNIVHDDISFSNPGNEEAMRQIQYNMEHAVEWKVPILVEREDGPNWGELK